VSDLVDWNTPTKVLCPECLRPTYHALNTDRYVCRTHGPVTTAEQTEPAGPATDQPVTDPIPLGDETRIDFDGNGDPEP
jgi:hypothetical protein